MLKHELLWAHVQGSFSTDACVPRLAFCWRHARVFVRASALLCVCANVWEHVGARVRAYCRVSVRACICECVLECIQVRT